MSRNLRYAARDVIARVLHEGGFEEELKREMRGALATVIETGSQADDPVGTPWVQYRIRTQEGEVMLLSIRVTAVKRQR